MAKKGKTMIIHGAFKSKSDAVKKENKTHGFIVERKIHSKNRYVVLTEKGKR